MSDLEKTPSSPSESKAQTSNLDYQHPAAGGKSGGSDANLAAEEKRILELGYAPEKALVRNRSLLTLLFQSLAIAAIPYGYGAPILSAIIGGGPLAMWLGWIIACSLNQTIAMSLAELASRYPTSAGPHYWTHQLASDKTKKLLSYTTGWMWLIGNWTITLSVTFGFATLLAAMITLVHPEFEATNWQLLLIFYGITLLTLVICVFLNKILPHVDTASAIFTLATIVVVLIALPATSDTHRSAADTLGAFDNTLSGWGNFGFMIGLLPAAYAFSALGMITSMAEETPDPSRSLPWALTLAIPVGLVAGLFFIIPICATLPPLADIIDNAGYSALPYIFATTTGSPGGGVALTVLVLIITLFCSISITVAASRTTFAFARDHGIPFPKYFAKVHPTLGVPVNALFLVTIVEMLLGLIDLGSSSAFTAFVSVGVIALALSYALPIAVSMAEGRKEVAKARWKLPSTLGWALNVIALFWIAFETVLFSMPTAIPTTEVSMNYAIAVLVGLMALAWVWYAVAARKVYVGPPEEKFL